MVKGSQDCVRFLLEYLEIDPESGLVKLLGGHGYFHLPVVAVEVFAVSLIVNETMGSGKRGVNP
jgi:hypothetical protein